MSKEKTGIQRAILLLLSLSAVLFFKYLPAPTGLSSSGMQVLGIFLGVLMLWLFEFH